MGRKERFVSQGDMKIGIIGDEDMVTGMVLAGAGHVDGQGRKNFMVVDTKTRRIDIEEKFNELTNRTDICMLLLTQGVAEEIRYAVNAYILSGKVVPTILEVPSKDKPYDPSKDAVMQRVFTFMPQAMEEFGLTKR